MKLHKTNKRNLTMYLWASLLFLLPVLSNAEEIKTEDKPRCTGCSLEVISGIYFTGGVGFLDLDHLNAHLSRANYSKIDQPTITLGGGLTVRLGRLVLDGQLHWLDNVDNEARANNLRSDVTGSYGLFRIGFDVVKFAGLSIYPIVGIGSGKMRLALTDERDQNFSEVLLYPGRDSILWQHSLLFDASLGIDYRFTLHRTEHSVSYFTVGVRGGYLFAPYAGDWRTTAAEISGGPHTGLTGPVVQLLIGFSGQGRRHDRMHRYQP